MTVNDAGADASNDIAKLSIEQEQSLKSFALEWSSVFREEPPDRQKVEEAITSLYRAATLAAPSFIWCKSPFQLVTFPAVIFLLCTEDSKVFRNAFNYELKREPWQLMWKDLKQNIKMLTDLMSRGAAAVKEKLPKSNRSLQGYPDLLFERDLSSALTFLSSKLLKEAGFQIGPRLGVQAQIKLRTDLYDQLRNNRNQLIRQNFGIRMNAAVGPNLTADLKEQLKPSTCKQLHDTCMQHLVTPEERGLNTFENFEPIDLLFRHSWNIPYSMEYPEWLPTFAFSHFLLGIEVEQPIAEHLDNWLCLKKNILQMSPFSRVCFVCEYPRFAKLDERGRLHNETGAALEFTDGFKVYAIDGVVVPPDVIEKPASLTVERIDREQNIETRRIMIGRFGLERYLAESDATVLDSDEYGTLYRKELRNDEPIVVVRVKDPTPDENGIQREYFLRVPPSMRTAKSAVAWTFNMSPDEYVPTKQS